MYPVFEEPFACSNVTWAELLLSLLERLNTSQQQYLGRLRFKETVQISVFERPPILAAAEP